MTGPETMEYLLGWMERWCRTHPDTTVVRFTSLFYNFVWIWGSNARRRNLFTDWGSYDFTVSDRALADFEREYGYRMAAVLGVDEDTGAKVCHGRWAFETEEIPGLLPAGCSVTHRENCFLTDGKAKVLLAHDGNPDLTLHAFGKGLGIINNSDRPQTTSVKTERGSRAVTLEPFGQEVL